MRALAFPILLPLALACACVRAQDASPPAERLEQAARIDASDPRCQPAYPAAALKAGVTGTTVVRLVVDAKGQVSRAEVTHSSGPSLEHRLMDYAFREALLSCPYMPGRDWKGLPVGGTIAASHVWRLPETATPQP